MCIANACARYTGDVHSAVISSLCYPGTCRSLHGRCHWDLTPYTSDNFITHASTALPSEFSLGCAKLHYAKLCRYPGSASHGLPVDCSHRARKTSQRTRNACGPQLQDVLTVTTKTSISFLLASFLTSLPLSQLCKLFAAYRRHAATLTLWYILECL